MGWCIKMIENKTNFGELALWETEKIKREIVQSKNQFEYSSQSFLKASFSANLNDDIASLNFSSQKQNTLNFCFGVRVSAESVTESTKLIVYLNGKKLKAYNINKADSFYDSISFLPQNQNVLQVKVASESAVLIESFECELSGYYLAEDASKPGFIVDCKHNDSGIGVVNNVNGKYYYHYFNNYTDFLNNFNFNDTSDLFFDNLLDFCFIKTISGTNVVNGNPVFLHEVDGEIYVSNNTKTTNLKVSTNADGTHALVVDLQNTTHPICYINHKNNMLTIKKIPANLLTAVTTSFSLQGSFKKLVLLRNTPATWLPNGFVLVGQNQLGQVELFEYLYSGLSIALNKKVRLGVASNFFAQVVNNTLFVFFVLNKVVKTMQLKRADNAFEKLLVTEVLNAEFGFATGNEEQVYYYNNVFDL